MTTDDRVGTVVDGRYRIDEIAGDELLGRVYLARDTARNKTVRLKILRPEYLLAEDGERFRRFQREIEAFGKVRSPGVLPLVDAGTHDALAYAVFPGLPERTLQHLIDEGPLEVRRATDLVSKVAVGIGGLHREGVIHRDLIASNVLVDDKDEVYIRDLGLASFVSVDDATASLTDADDRVGHVASMAPEYIATQTVHPGADLYALGVLAYHLLTGRPPFPGRANEVLTHHLSAVPPAPSGAVPSVPAWVDTLVLSLLEKEPARRPAPDIVVARLRRGWQETAPAAPVGRRTVQALATAIVVVSLVGAGLWVFRLDLLGLRLPEIGLVAQARSLVRRPVEPLPADTLTELWVVPAEEPLGTARVYATAAEATRAVASRTVPSARTGLLEIRSNQRVLVTLDGQALGYTPLKAWLPVGPHELGATLPARRDSRQERSIVVQESAPQAISLVF